MPVMGVARFERFFRAAAGLDVDKDDLKRFDDFVGQQVYDLLLIAQAAAKANRRDVVQPSDLPITKGLQESIHDFERIDQEVELQPILDQLAARPPSTCPSARRSRPASRPSSAGWPSPSPAPSRSSTPTSRTPSPGIGSAPSESSTCCCSRMGDLAPPPRAATGPGSWRCWATASS